MSVVIDVQNLGKLYRLGKIGTGTLSHDLKRWWALSRGKEDPFLKIGSINDRTKSADGNEYVWALRDVSFKVNRGDVVGVVGKNGAGKSTALKILSRITSPTSGHVKIRGRIGSLLEVGTGFHPEMTGRENVFMNGTVLGMRKYEIKGKFDDIVDFAGVSKYIDTPVKRYSSGMMVRLGFAVAAFLEPEILIVDEVLAVGDAEFQKRAIGKMQDVSKTTGRTVLFVSHNIAAVRSLCSRAILLANGHLSMDGSVGDVTDYYLKNESAFNDIEHFYKVDDGFFAGANIGGFSVEELKITKSSNDFSRLATGDDITIKITYNASEKFIAPAFIIKLKDHNQNELIRLSNMPISGYSIESFQGRGVVELFIKRLPLVGGDYSLDVGLAREKMQWFFNYENAVQLRVEPTDYYESGLSLDRTRGTIVVDHEWKHITC